MDLVIVAMSAPLENLKEQIKDKLSWRKSVYAIISFWKNLMTIFNQSISAFVQELNIYSYLNMHIFIVSLSFERLVGKQVE